MDLKDFKLYNLCIMRLKHQISIAREKGRVKDGRALLESYCTSDAEDIIDIHELYDIKDRSIEGVMSKLALIAADASLFAKEKIQFDFDEEGQLCLYLVTQTAKEAQAQQDDLAAA